MQEMQVQFLDREHMPCRVAKNRKKYNTVSQNTIPRKVVSHIKGLNGEIIVMVMEDA